MPYLVVRIDQTLQDRLSEWADHGEGEARLSKSTVDRICSEALAQFILKLEREHLRNIYYDEQQKVMENNQK